MVNRNIATDALINLTAEGEVIAEYENDKPYPSKLILLFIKNTPIHAVVAQNTQTMECIFVTCYIPDAELWDASFKRKIK